MEIPYVFLMRCSKRIWQNSTHIHDLKTKTKTSQQMMNTRNHQPPDKEYPQKTSREHHAKWWNAKVFSPKTANKARMSALSSLYSIVPEVFTCAIKQEKQTYTLETLAKVELFTCRPQSHMYKIQNNLQRSYHKVTDIRSVRKIQLYFCLLVIKSWKLKI